MKNLAHLSTIIPSLNQRAWVERAVQSALLQNSEIETETLVIDGGSRDNTIDHLRGIFSDEIYRGKLLLSVIHGRRSRAHLLNEGVARAGGSVLAFLNPGDYWKPGRLTQIAPLLKRHDLVLGTHDPVVSVGDWIRDFLARNPAVPSSGLIRRSLFEDLGGFTESGGGLGEIEYNLWLRALLNLHQNGRRDRFTLFEERYVVHEEGLAPHLPLPPAVGQKIRSLREGVTLIGMARQLPHRYWGELARRLLETTKVISKKRR